MESSARRTRLLTSGQAAVIFMIALAVLAAAFAWWWNFNRGRRALEFFGPEAAKLIRTAPKVELSRVWQPVLDISKANGLLNARTSLLGDASYAWNRTAKCELPQDAIKFIDGDKSAIILFDVEYRGIQIWPTGKTAALTKKTADGWRSYVNRQLGEDQLKPPGPKHTAPSE